MAVTKEKIVERGYDKIALDYHKWRQTFKSFSQYKEFSKRLPDNARVLDLGSGTGIPVAKFLAEEGHTVVGVDISSTMIRLSKRNVPQAKFIKGDMIKTKFKKESFDGVIAAYSLMHIPKEKHKTLFKKIRASLKPKGLFLFSTGIKDIELQTEFFKVPMFWSYYSKKRYQVMLKTLGFKLIFGKRICCDGRHPDYWILAQKWNKRK